MRRFSACRCRHEQHRCEGCRKMPQAGRKPSSTPDCCSTMTVQVDGAVDQDQPDHGQPHDQLVGDHLRGGADRASIENLVVGGPAASMLPITVKAAEGEHHSRPAFMSAICIGRSGRRTTRPISASRTASRHQACRPKGITATPAAPATPPRAERVGDAVVGGRRKSSLSSIFMPSARPWNRPHRQLDVRERDAQVGAVGADAVGHHRRCLRSTPGQDQAEGHEHADRKAM